MSNYITTETLTALFAAVRFSPNSKTKKEVEFASQNGFQAVSLGTSRLRTETAAIVACHTINLFL